MSYDLISSEDYANLPIEDDRCFVEFEGICRRNMLKIIHENSSTDFERAVREQYMASVSAVAAECGILNVNYNPDTDENFWRKFEMFSFEVQGAVARIRIRQRGESQPHSVLLTASTKTKIEHYIDRIRSMVEGSDLDQSRKNKLYGKLDELLKELSKDRLNFATTMAALVAITTVIAAATTISADGPSAIANIMRLIGKDKQSEDAAAERLKPPQKALPAPAKTSTSPVRAARAISYDLDDDLPF